MDRNGISIPKLYLGYTASAIGTLYLAHRIGLLDLVKNCIPKKICLFCVKNKVESSTHVITYNICLSSESV